MAAIITITTLIPTEGPLGHVAELKGRIFGRAKAE